MNEDLLWRAEMACRAAWPAEQEANIGGWVARRSGGAIRRVNSLNPLPGSQSIDDRLIDQAEAYYARFGQPAVIRLISFASSSEGALAKRGYQQNGATTMICADIDQTRQKPEEGIIVSGRAEADWLDAQSRLTDRDPVLFRSMLSMIREPTWFAAACIDGVIQSFAYGVIVDRLLVIESVATEEAHRSRGLARKIVQSLMNWAASQGVNQAVLQVETDNVPARALYRTLGFNTELFTYVYLRQPERSLPPARIKASAATADGS